MSARIGLVYDLRDDYLAQGFSEEATAEFDSEITLRSIEDALRALGHRPERIGHVRALCARLVAGDRWDLVFNFAEGLHGRSREAQVPALLEAYDIPYTFSDPLTCAVTLDKAVTKRLVRDAGLNTPGFHLVRTPDDIAAVRLPYPLFAKPYAEGTGKGVSQRSRIETPAALRQVCLELLERFRQPVLVEEYLPGREFTVAVLGTGADARVLGGMEIIVLPAAGGREYAYETKENWHDCVRYQPLCAAREPDAAVCALALAAHRTLDVRDASRTDIRLDAAGRPSFMEINVLPGLRPEHSDLPMIAAQQGVAYVDLMGAIVNSALART